MASSSWTVSPAPWRPFCALRRVRWRWPACGSSPFHPCRLCQTSEFRASPGAPRLRHFFRQPCHIFFRLISSPSGHPPVWAPVWVPVWAKPLVAQSLPMIGQCGAQLHTRITVLVAARDCKSEVVGVPGKMVLKVISRDTEIRASARQHLMVGNKNSHITNCRFSAYLVPASAAFQPFAQFAADASHRTRRPCDWTNHQRGNVVAAAGSLGEFH